ncbi:MULTISPECIES: hypothetical protein [unclassified Tenacibaculum]|uniref:hypothetical protein n=1 Tax=unclassified Tenacibaculum TaxID=2635139 RepID=UPI001F41CCC8|nr:MULTISPECIES: hypothetical protein [unclassified Tenacibaculum]MCF2875557.1 hypothetical protein [Tenacibaculum sp. Cn5-1]MCF2935633.1 hypothetical protein [Tenacibaculum sp. Cn5-34]MCG7512193.1 hypothetical protein [Tenacibaculum sp. Cn5-46]
MRIRTKKDLEKLDNKIKEELGIDIHKYRNEEVVENFVELLVFPKYVINWVIRPVLISILAFIIGFYMLDLVHVEYVLYSIIGLVLFLLAGFFMGLLFLIWKMKSDMWGIINYSLDIMKSAVADINEVSNQTTKENRKDVLSLLFKGVIHIITIPMVSKVVSDKVPFVGGIINRIIKKILTLVSDKVKFDEEKLKNELSKNEDEPDALKVYLKSISFASNGIKKVMNFTFGVAQFPLKVLFGIILLLLTLFLYLIN